MPRLDRVCIGAHGTPATAGEFDSECPTDATAYLGDEGVGSPNKLRRVAAKVWWHRTPLKAHATSLVRRSEICQDGRMRVTTGRWGGRTRAERRAERRQQLINAAVDIWTESGWAAVTMRGVCSTTGLNDRYFYEEFATRDELIVAAWDRVRDQMLGEVSAVFADRADQDPVETIRAAIAIVVDRIAQDPGTARILLTQHVGSSALQNRRAVALQAATQLVVEAARPHLKPDADETELRMDTFVAVGGFVELMMAWDADLLDIGPVDIINHTSRLAETLAQRHIRKAE